MPLFDVLPLQEFVADPGRTCYLTRLLSSFAVPESPPVPAGPFDLHGLALWLDQVLPSDRVTLLRCLGDLSLFLTGVLPDHTGRRPLRPVEAERLGRTVGLKPDEMLTLCERGSLSDGLDALESLGSRCMEPPCRGVAHRRWSATSRPDFARLAGYSTTLPIVISIGSNRPGNWRPSSVRPAAHGGQQVLIRRLVCVSTDSGTMLMVPSTSSTTL